jgi:hypothetical protein
MNCTLRAFSFLLIFIAGGVAGGEETRGYRVVLKKAASGGLGEPKSEAGSVMHRIPGFTQDKNEYAK